MGGNDPRRGRDAAHRDIGDATNHPRRDIASSDPVQRWWRPAYAFELTLECAALWIVLVHEFWTGDIATINALVGATTLLVAYWGFRFGVLGVYISGRTREKVSAATGQDAPRHDRKISEGGCEEKVIFGVIVVHRVFTAA